MEGEDRRAELTPAPCDEFAVNSLARRCCTTLHSRTDGHPSVVSPSISPPSLTLVPLSSTPS